MNFDLGMTQVISYWGRSVLYSVPKNPIFLETMMNFRDKSRTIYHNSHKDASVCVYVCLYSKTKKIYFKDLIKETSY